MKKLILTCVLCFLYLGITAQIPKKSLQIGVGGLPIYYPINNFPTGYSLRANIGYFLFNDISLGIIPFSGKVGDISSSGVNSYFRYYVMHTDISFFIEAGAGVGRLNYENTPQFNGTMMSINFGPGFHYQFKKSWTFELLFQYARLRNISFPDNTSIGHTIIPTLGIQYFFQL